MATTDKDPYILNDEHQKLLRAVSKFLRRDKQKGISKNLQRVIQANFIES